VRALGFLMAALLCSSVATAVGFHGALILGPLGLGCGILAVRTNERAKRRRRALRAHR